MLNLQQTVLKDLFDMGKKSLELEASGLGYLKQKGSNRLEYHVDE